MTGQAPWILVWLCLLLAACGGGAGGDSLPGPSPEDQSQVNLAALRSTLDLSTNRVTLQWYDVAHATRYQIERREPSGAWVVIDGVWAPPGGALRNGLQQYPQWTGVIDGPTTFRVEAVLSDYTLPLVLASTQSATALTVAAPSPLPSIEFDQPEPLEGPVEVSFAKSGGPYYEVSFSVDAFTIGLGALATPPPYTLHLEGYPTGTHVIYADLALSAAATVVIGRSVAIHTSKAAIQSILTRRDTQTFDAYLVATSDSGIASVAARVDTVPLPTLAEPNACAPLPCAPGQAFNAYRISLDTAALSAANHLFDAQAVDNAGNISTFIQLILPVPATASATIDSPVDGSVVSGTLHLSGSFSSGTPGPLEIMVTLSGAPVYDTTVSNTGATTTYAADVSLAGVTPGSHTLNTYTRVGAVNYIQTASAVIQVAASP